MKKTRIIATALAALMCVASFTGCGKTTSGKNSDNSLKGTDGTVVENQDTQTPEDAQTAPGTDYESTDEPAPIYGLNDYDWKYSDDTVMFTIGTHSVTFDEWRYYAMYYKGYMDGGDDSYWTAENESSFKSNLIDVFKEYAAIKLLATGKYGLALSEQNIQNIETNINSIRTMYGDELYNQLLEQQYTTEPVLKRMLEFDEYTTLLLEANATEEEVRNYAEENYVHVQHILVKTVDDNNQPLPEDIVAQKTAQAAAIAEEAKTAEDFYALVEKYGEDPGMMNNPDGYTFTYGEMVSEFEDTSFALKAGEISEPVKTTYGYHIIKKLPLDIDGIINSKSDVYWNIVSTVANDKLTDEVKNYSDSLEVVYTDEFNALTMMNIGVLKTQDTEAEEVEAE